MKMILTSSATNRNMVPIGQDLVNDRIFEGLIHNTFDIEVLVQAVNALLVLLPSTQSWDIVWKVFQSVLQFISNVGYRKELNSVMLNLLSLTRHLSPIT
jgi:hypothetical protein